MCLFNGPEGYCDFVAKAGLCSNKKDYKLALQELIDSFKVPSTNKGLTRKDTNKTPCWFFKPATEDHQHYQL
ncbi:hypothetical protein Q7C36_019539 [Tachysurus vachellii]|uniref:Uncharacterized protein n=1 Tax=Tachysurus vachellii TaxID=175792 RepID=A0AA88LXC9_TACVA|nr:hypothetical protein Q7C36_019539 [Tachysurus vachellii]